MKMKKTKKTLSRRSFVKAASMAPVVLPWFVPDRALGKESGTPAPSDRAAIAWVGCGGRGNYDASRLKRKLLSRPMRAPWKLEA